MTHGTDRHHSRRAILRAGASGLGALALVDMLAAERALRPDDAQAAAATPPRAKVKRVIWLFMAGAPSQFELFEPKETLQRLDGERMPPSLMAGKRFAFIDGERATLLGTRHRFRSRGESGAPISDLLPHIAGVADELCFLRGMHTKEINHGPAKLFMNTGHGQFGRPSFGSWSLYGLGSDARDLPGFVVLQSGSRGPRGGAPLWGNGFLPTRFAGTPLRGSGAPVLDLETPEGVSEATQADFFDAVGDLDRLGALAQAGLGAALDGRLNAYELAHRMQTSAPELVDLSGEPAEVKELYGLGDGGPSFARNCLLARRLVERGTRFVQLYHTDWDHHGDPNNHLGEPLEARCREVDRATAALIVDLRRRGLLEDTLVVWGGEFGRTPLGERRAFMGRDHHIDAFTLFLAGAGVKAGHSHGETDEVGFAPVAGAMDVHDLHATILHLMGVDHGRLTFRFQGRDFRLTDVSGRVVRDFLTE